jgi:hypothetical protein
MSSENTVPSAGAKPSVLPVSSLCELNVAGGGFGGVRVKRGNVKRGIINAKEVLCAK